MVDPVGIPFNFSDASDQRRAAPQQLWLARRYKQPLLAQSERDFSGGSKTIFHLIWSLGQQGTDLGKLPSSDVLFKKIDVAIFRTEWNNPQALFLGIKGGYNLGGHSHLDLGSFVLSLRGERWAIDLGPDNYELPGYFDYKKLRWKYFRTNNQGHNTLTIDGENQPIEARAPIVEYVSDEKSSRAVVDLTQAYAGKVTRAERTFSVVQKRRVRITDQLTLKGPAEIHWNFQTRAKIELNGGKAVLSLGKSKLNARILAPEDAHFEVHTPVVGPDEFPLENVKTLRIRIPPQASVRPMRIAVEFD